MMESRRELLKQQFDLIQIEREIKSVIPKLQEFINALKVEELQIKSSLLDAVINDVNISKPTSSRMASSLNVEDKQSNNVMDINQQEIKLEFLLKEFGIEEDSD